MRFSAFACGPPRHMLVGLATALGVLVVTSGTAMPAYSADLYYSDRYERPYRYSESYDRPYRYRGDYDEPQRLHRPPLRCHACGCGWHCGTPVYHRRPVFVGREPVGEPVIERRYIEREYVERRYPGPSRAYYRPRPYAEDFQDVPQPRAPIPSLPTSYYYDDE